MPPALEVNRERDATADTADTASATPHHLRPDMKTGVVPRHLDFCYELAPRARPHLAHLPRERYRVNVKTCTCCSRKGWAEGAARTPRLLTTADWPQVIRADASEEGAAGER